MDKLIKIYDLLYAHYGNPEWWSAESAYEVILGAILTQNTSWSNVEKAIKNFDGDLRAERIQYMSIDELMKIIRPAGFYRQKAQYIKNITDWLAKYNYDIKKIKENNILDIRNELLAIKGIGNETADSILLYAFDLPSFVVDAYTIRHFMRIPVYKSKNYDDIKQYCESILPKDTSVYNNFHALIVYNAKIHCKKTPSCDGCPLYDVCDREI